MKKTQKQSDLLKLSFVNIDYTFEDKTTTCKVLCKVNLGAWEQRYGKFTKKMKSKVLKNYFITETTTVPGKRISYRKVSNGVGDSKGTEIVVTKDNKTTEILPMFWVYASTTCSEDDLYDEERGKMIARRKAKRIAYRQMVAFLKDLMRWHMQPMLRSLQGMYNDMVCFADDKVLEEEIAD